MIRVDWFGALCVGLDKFDVVYRRDPVAIPVAVSRFTSRCC